MAAKTPALTIKSKPRRAGRACPSARMLSSVVLTVLTLGLLLAPAVSSASTLSFAPALRYPMLGGPMAIVAADLNGDANPDVATANFDRRSVGVLLGDGHGGFSVATYYSADSNVTDIDVGDFNGDGDEDIATSSAQGTVSLLLGDGTGAFAHGVQVAAQGSSMAVGDLDGDGHQDIVTGGSVLLGDGLGGFAPALGIPGPWGECVVGDLNADGKPDAAKIIPLFGWEHSYLEILLGDGAGRLMPSSLYRTRREPVGLAMGDLNADGRLDLVIGEDATNSLGEATAPGGFEVFAGDGRGTFAKGSMRATGEAVYHVVLADLDGDGRQDVVSNQMRRPNVVVARGDGLGRLLPALTFPAGAVPSDVAVADFNRDGMPDLATSARSSVRVLLSGPRAAPVLTSLSPTKGRAGAIVTLVGARFGARRAASFVTFGAVTATDYVGWSATRIRVKVPADSPAGTTNVRVRTVAGSSVARSFRVVLAN